MSGRVALCSAVMALHVIVVAAGKYELDQETAELCQMLRNTCGEETGVDMSLLDAINEGADLIPDPKLKCYMKCVMETAGMLDGGDVDVETTLELLPAPIRVKLEDIVRSCGSKRGADECETAYLTQECWQKKNKAAYYLV